MPSTQEMLDAVEAAILKCLETGGVVSYSIDGRTVQRAGFDELSRLRDKLKAQLANEKGGARTFVSFKNPQ